MIDRWLQELRGLSSERVQPYKVWDSFTQSPKAKVMSSGRGSKKIRNERDSWKR